MKVSVVIPCRNEKSFLKECVLAVLNSEIEKNIEISIYIVDGKSNDGTLDLIQELCTEFPNVFLIINEKQLTPFAFNLGILADKNADYIQIVGARHIISRNYISNCLKTLAEDTSIWCAGGKIINEYLNDSSKVISKAMSTTFGMGLGNFRTLEKSGFTDTVTSPMYPMWVFEKIGYFDEDLVRNQDDDFNFRVTKAEGKIFFDADISLKYYVRSSISGLRKQFYQYGYWKVFVNKKHKAVTTLRQLVPPFFVIYVLLFLLSSLVGLSIFLFSSIPLFLYVFLGIYFALKISEGFKEFIRILFIFPILHLSYGFGYLSGILDFFILNKKPNKKNTQLSR